LTAATGVRGLLFYAKNLFRDACCYAMFDSAGAGPLFFANLPAGKYKVAATAYSQTKEQSVTVTDGKQTAISFSW